MIKRVVKDKDGREVIEEEVTNFRLSSVLKKHSFYKVSDSSGNKYKVRTKVYKDSNGNEIIEEEKIDSNGKIYI